MPGISTVVVISQRPSSMFGAAKARLTENKNNNVAIIHTPFLITCSFLLILNLRTHFGTSQAGKLFFKFLQCGCQVFKGRSLVDIVDVDISDDSIFIDDKQSPFGHSVGTQHTIFLSYSPVRPKI